MPVGQNFLSQLKKVRVNKKTITRSIRDLMTDFQSTKIVIPAYQRTFVWDISKQCRFIESVFMDIPIPPLFFLEKFDEETDTTIFEIIDGVQRLTTLGNFVNGSLKLANLENLPDLNQSTFHSLPSNISGLFYERQINTIVIESDTNPEIQFEVFGRLNMGSVSLNAQELRNCMYHGDFNDFLIDCSKNQIYRQLLEPFPRLKPPKPGTPDKNRMFDVELILRFFAIYDLYNSDTNKYPESRGEIFNDYMRSQIKGEESLSNKSTLESFLIKILRMVQISFKENHFRNFNIQKDKAYFSNQLNAAVFDVQMLGFVDYDIEDISDKIDIIYDSFLELCSYDRNFIDAISRSTNAKVNERILIWKNKLKAIMENPDKHIEMFLQKKKLFDENSICNSSGCRLEKWEEVDFYDGKIYHRAFSPKLEMAVNTSTKRASVNTSVQMFLQGDELEFDEVKDALNFVVDHIVKKVSDDSHDISRLTELNYVGTQDELLSTIKGKKHIKKFGILENIAGDSLYIDVGGNRTENIAKIEQLASLFSFMSDFKIIN
ncbi:MAG: DUF262 domain-containing protein [Crinalium sp.]